MGYEWKGHYTWHQQGQIQFCNTKLNLCEGVALLSAKHVEMLGCGKFFSLVVNLLYNKLLQVVELLWARPLVVLYMSAACVRVVEFGAMYSTFKSSSRSCKACGWAPGIVLWNGVEPIRLLSAFLVYVRPIWVLCNSIMWSLPTIRERWPHNGSALK